MTYTTLRTALDCYSLARDATIEPGLIYEDTLQRSHPILDHIDGVAEDVRREVAVRRLGDALVHGIGRSA